MSHHPNDRRNRERPVQAATIDRRERNTQEKSQPKPVKPHQLDKARGAAVGKTQTLPAIRAGPAGLPGVPIWVARTLPQPRE
jgi:hypothetical protein